MHHFEHRHNQSTTSNLYTSNVNTSSTFLKLGGLGFSTQKTPSLIIGAESKVSLTKFPFKKLTKNRRQTFYLQRSSNTKTLLQANTHNRDYSDIKLCEVQTQTKIL